MRGAAYAGRGSVTTPDILRYASGHRGPRLQRSRDRVRRTRNKRGHLSAAPLGTRNSALAYGPRIIVQLTFAVTASQ